MKRPVLPILGLLILLAIVFGLIFTLSRASQTEDGAAATISCTKTGRDHLVVIKNNQAVPQHTAGNACDRLTITNDDDKIRLMAFGAHDHHRPYDGTTEKVLDKGQSLSVTLDQTGTFKFHDHLDDTVQGTFTVTK